MPSRRSPRSCWRCPSHSGRGWCGCNPASAMTSPRRALWPRATAWCRTAAWACIRAGRTAGADAIDRPRTTFAVARPPGILPPSDSHPSRKVAKEGAHDHAPQQHAGLRLEQPRTHLVPRLRSSRLGDVACGGGHLPLEVLQLREAVRPLARREALMRAARRLTLPAALLVAAFLLGACAQHAAQDASG